MTSASWHEAEVGRQFDRAHGRFREELREDDPRLEAVRHVLGPNLGAGPILDLGCGKGRFALQLERAGAEVIGLDRSPEMIGRAGIRGRVLGSSRRLPLSAGSLAGVLAVEVFEHLPPASWSPTLIEIRRVLRRGGRLVVVDKSAVALDRTRPWLPALVVKRIDEHRGLWMYPRGTKAHERWFWPGQLERLMRRAGFIGVEARPLASADECHPIFRAYPSAGRFRVWSAIAPEGSANECE